MKSSNHSIAVVVGHDHQNTLGVIRSLGEAGFRVKAVLLADERFCFTAHSKYIDEVVVAHKAGLIDTLIRLSASFDTKVPLIPCADDAMASIASSYDQLVQLYHLPCAVDGNTTLRLMNKIDMLAAAKAAGLNVPRWVSLTEENFHTLQNRCAELNFPLILKPIELNPDGQFEFRIIADAGELGSCLDYIRNNCKSIIVQEYIQKTGEFGVNGCRLHHSGETIFGGVVEKARFSQTSLGSTTAGTICPDRHGLCEATQKFVDAIDYRGIFDIEFISDGSQVYFVEMNFRNGGYGYAYTKAGRNFPAIWASEAYGESAEALIQHPVQSIFFISESADLQNVRAGNLSLIRLHSATPNPLKYKEKRKKYDIIREKENRAYPAKSLHLGWWSTCIRTTVSCG